MPEEKTPMRSPESQGQASITRQENLLEFGSPKEGHP